MVMCMWDVCLHEVAVVSHIAQNYLHFLDKADGQKLQSAGTGVKELSLLLLLGNVLAKAKAAP